MKSRIKLITGEALRLSLHHLQSIIPDDEFIFFHDSVRTLNDSKYVQYPLIVLPLLVESLGLYNGSYFWGSTRCININQFKDFLFVQILTGFRGIKLLNSVSSKKESVLWETAAVTNLADLYSTQCVKVRNARHANMLLRSDRFMLSRATIPDFRQIAP